MANRNASGTARPTAVAVPCGLMLMAIEGAIRATETPTADHTLRVRRSVGAACDHRLRSAVFQDQCRLRARRDTLTGALFVAYGHFVFLEDRVALVVDRKQFWVNGIALGMAHAEISLETNTHRQHFRRRPSLPLDTRLGHHSYGLMVFSPT